MSATPSTCPGLRARPVGLVPGVVGDTVSYVHTEHKLSMVRGVLGRDGVNAPDNVVEECADQAGGVTLLRPGTEVVTVQDEEPGTSLVMFMSVLRVTLNSAPNSVVASTSTHSTFEECPTTFDGYPTPTSLLLRIDADFTAESQAPAPSTCSRKKS